MRIAGVLILLACAADAQAQSFLPRAGYYFQWSALAAPDPRFGSDGAMGVDVDLVDYGRGRLNFAADHEAVLGHEARPFEINHDNFAMEAFGTMRLRSTEVAAAFHHVSRHLSDRSNPNIIAWNVLDFRAMRRLTVKRGRLVLTLSPFHTFTLFPLSFHPIPARGLRSVERLVGGLDQRGRIRGGGARPGDAETDGEGHQLSLIHI